jgi:hypothetical protein
LSEFKIIRARGNPFKTAWQTAEESEGDKVMSRTNENEKVGNVKETSQGLGESLNEPLWSDVNAQKTPTTSSPRQPQEPSPRVPRNPPSRRSSIASIREYPASREPSSDTPRSKRFSFPLDSARAIPIEPWLEQNAANAAEDAYVRSLDSIRTVSSRRTSSSSFDETSDTGRAQVATAQANKNSLGTRIRISNVEVNLMRCAIIDGAASELERKTYRRANTPASQEYAKMHNIVQDALRIAQILRSDGLKARCHYWKGRTCGRQRFWLDAKRAFEKAEELDQAAKENDHEKGLLPSEKADIKFLKRSVQKRAERADKDRKEREELIARIEWRTEQAGIEDPKVVDAKKSPMWRPETESAIRQWMERFGRTFESSPDLGSDGASIRSIDRSSQDEDETLERDWVKRPLSEAELRYVEHGDGNQATHTRRRNESPKPSRPSIATQKLRGRPSNLRISSFTSNTFGTADGLGITVNGTPGERDWNDKSGFLQ